MLLSKYNWPPENVRIFTGDECIYMWLSFIVFISKCKPCKCIGNLLCPINVSLNIVCTWILPNIKHLSAIIKKTGLC